MNMNLNNLNWKEILNKAFLGGIQAGIAGLAITSFNEKALIPAMVGFVVRFGLAFFKELNEKLGGTQSTKVRVSVGKPRVRTFLTRILELA